MADAFLSQTVMGKSIEEWIEEVPIISDVMQKKETFWINEKVLPFEKSIKQKRGLLRKATSPKCFFKLKLFLRQAFLPLQHRVLLQ